MISTIKTLEYIKKQHNIHTILQNKSGQKITGTQKELTPILSEVFEPVEDIFTKEHQELKKLLSQAVKSSPIGSGAYAKVYRIPMTDFVVRVPHQKTNFCWDEIDLDVSAKDKINFYTARIGSDIQIGKYIDGVDSSLKKAHKNLGEIKNDIKQFLFNEKILELPPAAFKRCLERIFEADRLKMNFDFVGNNLRVKVHKHKIVPIDFQPLNPNMSGSYKFNPIADLLWGFNVPSLNQQIRFAGKITTGLTELLRPENKIPIDYGRFMPKIPQIGFNTAALCEERMHSQIEFVNSALAEISEARRLNENHPNLGIDIVLNDKIDLVQNYLKKHFK